MQLLGLVLPTADVVKPAAQDRHVMAALLEAANAPDLYVPMGQSATAPGPRKNEPAGTKQSAMPVFAVLSVTKPEGQLRQVRCFFSPGL